MFLKRKMINKNLTFIIPAAGKSSRFKSEKSKIFFHYRGKSLISHVVEKCFKYSNKIIVITNRKNISELKKLLSVYKKINFTFVLQNRARGMGHAISLGLKNVQTKYSSVIWSDQIFLTSKTIEKTFNFFNSNHSLLCFPVYKKKLPYVYILRDRNQKFKDIIQTREGAPIVKMGESDCGFFVFQSSIIKLLLQKLIKTKKIMTKKTNEIDFLKAFKYFNTHGSVDILKATNHNDTIGINSIEDLA